MFKSVGYSVNQLGWGNYVENRTGSLFRHGANGILVIPHKEALLLGQDQTKLIAANIKMGAHIITDGDSQLGVLLGINFGKGTVEIKQYTWQAHPEIQIVFPSAIPALPFLPPKNAKVLGHF